MIWIQIGIFGSGVAVGGFLGLGLAVLVLAPDLKRLRLAVDLLAARRKPGRKPRAATAENKSRVPEPERNPRVVPPAMDNDLVHRQPPSMAGTPPGEHP